MYRGHEYPGRFITFDGPDGSGKTTQFRRLIRYADKKGLNTMELREPGGTEIGEAIRTVLLSHYTNDDMDANTELLLYNASRSHLVEKLIEPGLRAGRIVFADRFDDSTKAYQGAGDLNPSDINEICRIATRGIKPDRSYFFDVSPEAAAKRLNPLLDRMEAKSMEFHAKVRANYLRIAEEEPERIHLINTDNIGEEELFEIVKSDFERTYEKWLNHTKDLKH